MQTPELGEARRKSASGFVGGGIVGADIWAGADGGVNCVGGGGGAAE